MVDNLTRQLINIFIEQIKTGVLKPGDKIDSQRDIAKNYQMARSTVREALQALILLDILKSIPGKGVYVSELSLEHMINPIGLNLELTKENFQDFYESRMLLETWALEQAMVKTKEEDILIFEKMISNMKHYVENDEDLYTIEDFKFHSKIFELSGNNLIISIFQLIKENYEYWIRLSNTMGKPKNIESFKEHTLILECIKSKDIKKAKYLLSKHLGSFKEKILQYLSAKGVSV